jgi:hypothetical protein
VGHGAWQMAAIPAPPGGSPKKDGDLVAWTLVKDADVSAAFILDSMGAWHPEVISRAVTVLMNDRCVPLHSPSSASAGFDRCPPYRFALGVCAFVHLALNLRCSELDVRMKGTAP